MNGRCQGFFCGAEVGSLVEAHRCPAGSPEATETRKEAVR